MALYHTSEIYHNIGVIQDLLERFGNKVAVISASSLDYYKEEIQGLNTQQFNFVLEILRSYKSAAQFLDSQDENITEKERIIAAKEERFNAVLKAKERFIEGLNAILEAQERLIEAKEKKFNIELAYKERMITSLQKVENSKNSFAWSK